MIVSELLQRMKNGTVVFLDGRNEHGSHVLPSFPTWLEIELTEEALHEQAEEIIAKAERLGFAIGDHVWARFTWIREEYHHGYWEFEEVDADLSRLICPAEEDPSGAQRSELTRLAQDEPVSSPPSTGGGGEAAALKTTGWAALAQNRNIRLWSADFDTVHTFAMFNGCEVVRLVSPSPEMGEIARDLEQAWQVLPVDNARAVEARSIIRSAIQKLKENGLSREELGGLARSQPGSDAQERSQLPPSQGGDANPSDGSGA